mmetsp:Transcript_189/g.636  ORF Transcript_189/g.636 Transcript_189/m.636 type:complete len:113 (+) Transcript_189:557-895(+)
MWSLYKIVVFPAASRPSMTTRMSRLPKRMSKALLNDVIVLETALPIFYYRLGLQRLGLFFPFAVWWWCLSLLVSRTPNASRKGIHNHPHERREERDVKENKSAIKTSREMRK